MHSLNHEKYAPRIAAAHFKSTVVIEHIKIFTDLAVLVTHFDVRTTDRATGKQAGGSGRLIIGYRRDNNDDW